MFLAIVWHSGSSVRQYRTPHRGHDSPLNTPVSISLTGRELTLSPLFAFSLFSPSLFLLAGRKAR
eukprot:2319105-Rhodomonas_salina.1